MPPPRPFLSGLQSQIRQLWAGPRTGASRISSRPATATTTTTTRQASTRTNWSQPRRWFSQTKPRRTTNGNGGGQEAGSKASSARRIDKIISRLPAFLRPSAAKLRAAPVSHAVAFLILHEITAVVPLFALFALFHYTTYVPIDYMLKGYGGYVEEGVGRFERYFKRKGWFGFSQDESSGGGGGEDAVLGKGEGVEAGEEEGKNAVLRRWESTDEKYRVVVEVALAYAATKILLPARIALSLAATPWFAGVLARIRRVVPLKKPATVSKVSDAEKRL